MTTLREAAQAALKAIEHYPQPGFVALLGAAEDALSAALAQEHQTPELPYPPVGALTSGEVALLRKWAEDYARAVATSTPA